MKIADLSTADLLYLTCRTVQDELLLIDWSSTSEETGAARNKKPTSSTVSTENLEGGVSDNNSLDELESGSTPAETQSITSINSSSGHSKRIAFLFDSTLTAFLMMGNLSPVCSDEDVFLDTGFKNNQPILKIILTSSILYFHYTVCIVQKLVIWCFKDLWCKMRLATKRHEAPFERAKVYIV